MNRTVKRWAAGLCLLAAAGGCEKKEEAEAEPLDLRPLVRVGALRPAHAFTDGVRVQGTARTKFSASVAARVPGTLDEVRADEGDSVKAGQPLFQVDKATLEDRVRLAQDDLSVAKALLREAEAALLEAEASFAKAEVDAGRMRKLYEESRAVTRDTWEKADLQFKLAGATRERGRAAVESARVRIVQAETALSVVRKNLSDSLGVAPFDGVITRKRLDKGDFANVGSVVFEMDDPRVYEVCFSMNAAHYDRVSAGATAVRFADGKEVAVTYKAPSVHPVTRTFEIRVTVERAPDLAPGMLRDATVVFRQFSAAAVPSTAVGLRGGRRVVFVVRDGKVASVPVEAGVVWQGYTEIKQAEPLGAAEIVVEGMLLLNEGDGVRVEKE
jgi:RND family efflux transporter MFP subunit